MNVCARILVLVAVPLLFAACQKPQAEEWNDMHPFTEEELRKQQLDQAFAVFVDSLDLASAENPRQELLRNSRIRLRWDGTIRYTYTKNNLVLVQLDYRRRKVDAVLYGGIGIKGTLGSPLQVYVEETYMADLVMERFESVESGQSRTQLLPVLQFPDGSSYAVTSLLLVEPLIDYLLENVFSTE